jgi:hypothetical protein
MDIMAGQYAGAWPKEEANFTQFSKGEFSRWIFEIDLKGVE